MPLLDQADADEETKFIVEGMRARRANSPERSPSPVRQKSPDARHRKKLAQGRRNRTDTEEPVEETPAKDQDLPKVDPLPTVSDAPPDARRPTQRRTRRDAESDTRSARRKSRDKGCGRRLLVPTSTSPVASAGCETAG